MKQRICLIVSLTLLLVLIPVSTAQSDALLAFMNGSGQLVVSSGDGGTRWIVTNPGQAIDTSMGFNWTDEGNLVFGITGAGMFMGDPNSQAIIRVDESDLATRSYLNGLSNRPNIAQPQGVTPDGNFSFMWSQGQYGLVNLSNNSVTSMPINGNQGALGSGLWSPIDPIVAYWGFDNNNGGTTALSVVHAPSQNAITLNSGGQLPITPVAWHPDTSQLLYRTSSGDVQMTDVRCVADGCRNNPLESGITVAPSTATHIQVTTSHIFYVSNQQVIGADLSCVQNNNCLDSAFVIGNSAVPLSMMHVQEDRLVYTAYANDPNNPADRLVQLVDLTCVPDCQPQTILNGAMAGLLSPQGDYLMVDIVGSGLNILQVTNGSLVYLTDTVGGQLGAGLNTARWR